MRCINCVALLFTLVAGCARWEIETLGIAPTVTEVALVAGSGEFAELVQRALEAESMRVVERKGAQFLLYARFELEFHSRPYVAPEGPPDPRYHLNGPPGFGFGCVLPTSNDLESGRFEPPPVTERVAVLTLRLVRAPTGAHLWTGRALDWGRAANWPAGRGLQRLYARTPVPELPTSIASIPMGVDVTGTA